MSDYHGRGEQLRQTLDPQSPNSFVRDSWRGVSYASIDTRRARAALPRADFAGADFPEADFPEADFARAASQAD